MLSCWELWQNWTQDTVVTTQDLSPSPAWCTGDDTTAGEGRPTDTTRTDTTAARCEAGPSSPYLKTKLSIIIQFWL